MLTSLLGKNPAEDTADFGKDSMASKRHLGTARQNWFPMSIRLLWHHVFCTQDLEHALSSAYVVKHATPHPWCICVDSSKIFMDKHFRGHDIMEAVAVAAEAAN